MSGRGVGGVLARGTTASRRRVYSASASSPSSRSSRSRSAARSSAVNTSPAASFPSTVARRSAAASRRSRARDARRFSLRAAAALQRGGEPVVEGVQDADELATLLLELRGGSLGPQDERVPRAGRFLALLVHRAALRLHEKTLLLPEAILQRAPRLRVDHRANRRDVHLDDGSDAAALALAFALAFAFERVRFSPKTSPSRSAPPPRPPVAALHALAVRVRALAARHRADADGASSLIGASGVVASAASSLAAAALTATMCWPATGAALPGSGVQPLELAVRGGSSSVFS